MSGSKRLTDIDSLEAALAILFAMALQVLLAILSAERHWHVWTLPWFIWLALIVPEIALLVFLTVRDDPHAVFTLALTMGVVNLLAVTVLIGSVVSSHEHSGGQLLLKGITVWATNVTAFGLAFWEVAHWGRRRRQSREFRFPQQESESTDWKPSFFDFFYVSFTNSIAFSPTDTMPMTKRAKLLMLFESAVSAIAILLVAARAVNIFK
jgi:uncharacterized membrane protein